ncbi:hypothetical protein N7495_003692 [Penicillium taxi]|uniref:uncharacterized protein n=1 Tax=Penicillium taxi TaxID=168475 RepID=UPI002545ACC9|nr:uncharacterized protein N7495_003692 [Penicillium taxi]KAJ5898948.1 hypothetical protein N7495_003692 [Penicillium taxi]
MATPSAKPGTTPTYLTPSPHPSSAPLARSLAHKSPSTRTPTASGPGHTQGITSSSHQYSTPLAVSSNVDDPVNFTSPSALLALGGFTGISPSPAIHDGLVGAGMNDSDIHNLEMSLKLSGGRDSDVEQRHRIEEVVAILRTRVAGYGVSREGVERLSQLEGFESIWQNNDINIAGNFVDLEIEFHAGYDVVKNVSLRYATPNYDEGERREEATEVLKRNLVQDIQDADTGNWRSLKGFHTNLQWLASLDKLSQEVNCFEALEGLEESFRRVWEEEKRNPNLAMIMSIFVMAPLAVLECTKPKALDTKQQDLSSDGMAIDGEETARDREVEEQERMWTVMIECEEGYPSLRISKEWIGSEVFTSGEQSELSPAVEAAEFVNWLEPPPTMRLSHGNHPDPMAVDSSMLESTTPNRRFVAKLQPALDVPILVASDIYRHLGMQLPQEFKLVPYDESLVSESNLTSQLGRKKCRTSVHGLDSTGQPFTKNHNYTFQAFESVPGRKIYDLPFSHPRQLTDIIPILRQYAMLASLIRKVFSISVQDKDKSESPKEPLALFAEYEDDQDIITLGNDDSDEEKLDILLETGFSDEVSLFSGEGKSHLNNKINKYRIHLEDVKVDVTLRTQLGQAPTLMLLITDPGEQMHGNKTSRRPAQFSLCFEVGPNGRISALESTGLIQKTKDDGDTDMQGTDVNVTLQELHQKISEKLETSQDLGILVEWVLRWLRQRAGSG